AVHVEADAVLANQLARLFPPAPHLARAKRRQRAVQDLPVRPHRAVGAAHFVPGDVRHDSDTRLMGGFSPDQMPLTSHAPVDWPRAIPYSRFVLTSEPQPPAAQLFAGYQPIDGTYDELVESGGRTRDHARVVANILANMTPDAFARSQA